MAQKVNEDDHLFREGRADVKARWGDGPWAAEPDRAEWWHSGSMPADGPIGQYTVPCLALRGPFGQWNGYVGARPGHPWYGRKDADIDAQVHGGLTFAGKAHKPIYWTDADKKQRGYWWIIGFDCGHAWDLQPGLVSVLHAAGVEHGGDGHYWTLAEVTEEINLLADQVLALVAESAPVRGGANRV